VRWQRLARALPQVPRWLAPLVSATGGATAPAVSDDVRELAALPLPARIARVADRLRVELRQALGLADDEPVPGDEELSALGVDSLLAIEIPQVLSARFGLALPSTLLHEQRTIDALAAHLAARLGATSAAPAVAPSVLVLKRAAARAPLICLGGAPGDAMYLGELARHLPADQPFYALQAPGLDGRGAPLGTIEAIAARHLADLRADGVVGPWHLAGHSFGGFVAFEMARQLRAAGERVDRVALIDAVGVDWNDAALPFDEDWVAGELARVLFYTAGAQRGLVWDDLAGLPPRERVLRLVGSGGATDVARPLVARLVAVMKANLEAMVRYRPGVVDVDLHLFRARDALDGVLAEQFTVSDAPDVGWGAHTRGAVHVHPVPGNHFSMMGEPHVRALAAALAAVLDAPAREVAA
jgi:thioesterase domain-containing protein/acyl carrier protein